MAIPVDTFTASIDAVRAAASSLASDVTTVKALDDQALLAAQAVLSDARRAVDACASLIAGEIGYRSRRELGYRGLAQREGYRSPEALIQHATGSTGRDAATLVQVGTLVRDALTTRQPDDANGTILEEENSSEPWLIAVGAAVSMGQLSIDAAKAIRVGLGKPTVDETTGLADGGISAADLRGTVEQLIGEATGLNVDQLFRRARQLRDDLDETGIAEREKTIHQERALRRVRRANGLPRYILDPDLETGTFWDSLYNTLTSPRRGGPRFIDPAEKTWAEAIATDQRSTEQYLHDAITQLLRIGIAAETRNSHRIIGTRPPAVRVLVTADALTTRTGHGRIEGSDTPVSIETVERVACTAGTVPLIFDASGQPIDLGREQRLYNHRQRIALAARDGGCRWPGCDRPPSWAEAHHIHHWHRDHGQTDLADGLLLCRHHHMLLHNNHWEIRRYGAEYWLTPPPDIDPTQTPRPMPTKSAALRDLTRARNSETQEHRTQGQKTG